MKRFVLCALAATMLLTAAAMAQDSTVACQVEDWRWYHTKALRILGVEGVTTCDSGQITIRVYDRKDGARVFLGVESTFIEGRIFQATIFAVDPRPADPMVEFTVMPDE